MACLLAVSLVWSLPVSAVTTFHPKSYIVTVGATRFTVQEVDVGIRYGCPKGAYTGILLKDNGGVPRWSFHVTDSASYLASNGCKGAGISAARLVGIAVPTRNDAIWVVQVHRCGASCAGDDAHVFRFSPRFASINPATGYYDAGSVEEEINQSLGEGGVKFTFPRLALYVNNGYHECPSHWTRMIYAWTTIPGWTAKFVLVNAVAYTSHQCVFSHTHWPPDPGE